MDVCHYDTKKIKTMHGDAVRQARYSKIMIALFCSYLMISISPIFNETMTVVATTYVQTNWDDVNVQNDFTGTTGSVRAYQENAPNEFDIIDNAAWYYSAPRCLRMRASRAADALYTEGNITMLVNHSYIGTTWIYFKMWEDGAAGTPECNRFRFYFTMPNGTECLRFSIGDFASGSALHGFEIVDAGGAQQRVYTLPGAVDWNSGNFNEFCLVITHLYGNAMNYSLYNWTGDFRGGITSTSRTAYDWTTWSKVRIDGDQNANNGGALTIRCYLDNIIASDEGFPPDVVSVNATLHNQSAINISWVEPLNVGSDNWTIVGQYGAWPVHEYDGVEVFNASGNSTLINYTHNYYYRIFGYNATYNIYSVGVPIYFAVAEFNVYNGTDLSRINFSLEITRLGDSYFNDTCNFTGPFIYDIVNGINGTNCRITISNDSFAEVVFIEDLTLYNYYRFFIYMYENARPAYITVVDENGAPLSNALIDVYRFINGTYTYIASDLTDSSGEAMFWLVHNISHQFNITITDYELQGSPYWTPTPADDDKTFIMTYTYTNVTPVTPADCINFIGRMYANASIMISYTDRCGNTTNADFTLGNIYNSSFSINATSSTTDNNTWVFWETNVNTSRYYRCILNANHTQLGYLHNYSIYIAPLPGERVNESWLESLFDGVLGDWEFGWVIFFLIYLPALLFIISFGSMGHPGLGVLSGGGWVLFVNGYVLFGLETTFIMIGSILAILGILAIIAKKGRSLMQ